MINVSTKQILPELLNIKRLLHIKTPQEERLLSTVLEDMTLEANARFWYKKVNFGVSEVSFLIKDSRDLAATLASAKEGFVVICTIGAFIKELLDKYKTRGETVCVLYADKIASLMTENLAQNSSQYLLEKFYSAKGHKLTKRYSPGYGDLPLDKQKVLFGMFSDVKLDVTLTSSYYMEPEKSVSYIVGVLGEKDEN